MNLITVFFTGLLAGGLSCLAVQGGLLTSSLSQIKTQDQPKAIWAFLIAKLLANTLLGVILGLVGSAFRLSLSTQIFLQLAVIIFMVGSALNLLEVHPIFRYFAIQPPKFLTRLIRKYSKSENIFAPVILGAFTIFIPCGTTQAMMALAVSTGSTWQAAATMFSFVLGTTPVFFIVGFLTTKLSEVWQKKFTMIAATSILILATINLNATLTLSGSKNFTDIIHDMFVTSQNNQSPVSEITINIGPGGYSPREFAVKAGNNITLHLKNNGGGGCAAAFTIPALNISKVVQINHTEDVSFIAPSTPGNLVFTCSMGMYSGVIKIL